MQLRTTAQREQLAEKRTLSKFYGEEECGSACFARICDSVVCECNEKFFSLTDCIYISG